MVLQCKHHPRNMEARRELALVRQQNIDGTNFEDQLADFKDKFGRNYRLASERFAKAIDEIDKSKPVYVNCFSGMRSYIACRILAGNGFECYNFSGGFRFYDAVMNDRCLIESATACGMDK